MKYTVFVAIISSMPFIANCGGDSQSAGEAIAETSNGDAAAIGDTGRSRADGAHSQVPSTGADSGAEASAHCEAGAGDDSPDDDGIDSDCDGVDGHIGHDVYVSEAGDDTHDGTPSEPMRSIAAAIGKANVTKGAVLVAQGSYDVTSLSLPPGTRVIGGYEVGFIGRPRRELTVLRGGPTGIMLGDAERATFAHVTIEGDSAIKSMGMSAYALRSRVMELTLDDVVLRAKDALHGEAGRPGSAGVNGSTSKYNSTCKDDFCPVSAGGNLDKKLPAQQGRAGRPGVNGSSALNMLRLDNELIIQGDGRSGQSNGTAGCAGGDGVCVGMNIGNGGIGGGGGCPGGGGQGGLSGGTSVALLVLRGHVKLQRSELVTGLGGDGGAGGVGGAGGKGGAGGPPIGYGDVPATCSPASPTSPSNDVMGRNCATYGAAGGQGGAGGHGGGGAGGSSIGIVTAPDTTAKHDDRTVFSLGPAGLGGDAGKSGYRAVNGQRLVFYSL